MAKKKPPNGSQNVNLKLPATFGGVSFGKKAARIRVSVDRGELALGTADKTLCDRRLTVTIIAASSGDQRDQGRLPGMSEELELTGSADVKGFGVHSNNLSFGLTFNSKDIEDAADAAGVKLQAFAGREGYVKVNAIADIPEEVKEETEEGEEEGEE